MDDQGRIVLSTPDPDLGELSVCDTTAAGVTSWIEQLPLADTRGTAEAVKDTTAQIARLDIPIEPRLELLEAIRPTLQYVCTRLDRASVSGHAQADEMAQLAQRLQGNLCVGYKTVLRDAQPQIDTNRALLKETVPLACHRALSDMSRTLLRAFQLYIAPADNLWLELNQLYLLAEQLKLQHAAVADGENHGSTDLTIEQAYLRSALLNLARPNQLRHRDLTLAYNTLEGWLGFARIEPVSEQTMFAVDLARDRPPMHRRRTTETPTVRGIRTDRLVYELDAFMNDIAAEISVPEQVSGALLQHLVSGWGSVTKRNFQRVPTTGSLKVCVGLRSSHYFLSGGVDFAEQVATTDALLKREVNPFLREDTPFSGTPPPRDDVWSGAFDLRVRIPENPNIEDPDRILLNAEKPEPKENAFRFYDAEIVDASPNGYRIELKHDRPAQLQSGELLAIRDESDPRWCMAVARWLRQGTTVTMGVELLSPRAIPVAARVIQKKGGPTDFARALLLPELKSIDQPALLITPNLPFQPNQKVHIQRQGIQTTAQLSQRVLTTESFTQFTFRMLDGYLENAQIDLNISADWDKDGDEPPASP